MRNMKSKATVILTTLTILTSAVSSTTAAIRYVKASAAGANNGTSWADAYTDLQAALTAAQIGDQIWVAAAVYKPVAAGGPRTTSFEMRSGIAIFGGFAGTETQFEQRKILENVTTLSGDVNSNDPAFITDNSFHVVRAINVDASGILDGFTVRAGRGRGGTGIDRNGAGLLISGGAPLFRNCTFRENIAHDPSVADSGGDGGAAYISGTSSPVFQECLFISNQAGNAAGNLSGAGGRGGDGGAVRAVMDGTLRFKNCLFDSNRSGNGGRGGNGQLAGRGGDGGAISQNGGTIELVDCSFLTNLTGNGAVDGTTTPGWSRAGGGGAMSATATAARITRCRFTSNQTGGTTGGDGGAIQISSGPPSTLSNSSFTGNTCGNGQRVGGHGGAVYVADTALAVTNATFRSNRAGNGGTDRNTAAIGGSGGALFHNGGDLTVSHCEFADNRAGDAGGSSPLPTSAGSGGAVFTSSATFRNVSFLRNSAGAFAQTNGSGGAVRANGAAAFVNCLFAENSAPGDNSTATGGAIYAQGNAALINCTVAENVAAAGLGGGVKALSTITVDNCILWNNADAGGTDESAQLDGLAPGAVNFSAVQGWTGALGGAGNVGFDPHFLSGFRLAAGSPCIDAANNAAVPAGITVDVNGNARFADDPDTSDTGVGTPPIVDMGAAEFRSSAGGRVVYVRPSATGANDGTSWADAYTGLQPALLAAQSGDQIWVAAAVYKPVPPGGQRATSFELHSGVAMYGGFVGTETELAQRDFTINTTVLSGDISGDDPTTDNNSYHVIRVTGAAPDTVLDGFTIRGGNSSGAQTPLAEFHGAGLNIRGSTLLVANCVIRDNTAWTDSVLSDLQAYNGGNGGGALIESSSVDFVSCRFEGNRAGRGGDNSSFNPPGNGGSGGAIAANASDVQCTDCTFVNNLAGNGAFAFEHPGGLGGGGGAIWQTGQKLVLNSCTFTGNLGGDGNRSGQDDARPAPGGAGGAILAVDAELIQITGGDASNNRSGGGAAGNGGAFALQSASTSITGMTFSNNACPNGYRPGGSGGAIHLNSPAPQRISDCVFVANQAGSLSEIYNGAAGNGGAIAAIGPVEIDRCSFEDNLAGSIPNRSGQGGSGGAIYAEAATIVSSTFLGNKSGYAFSNSPDGAGGAVYLTQPSAILACLLAGNQTQGGDSTQTSDGGAIRSSSDLRLTNCTIANNLALANGGGVVITTATAILEMDNCTVWANSDGGGSGESAQLNGLSPNDTVDYSLVAGWTGANAGVGTSAADPLFVAADDYRLQAGSPGIDSGNGFAVPFSLTTDLDGHPRISDNPSAPNTGAPYPTFVDRGAYETIGSPYCNGDLDGNQVIDAADLALLLSAFGTSGVGLAADVDRSGTVDLADLAILLSAFGSTCS